MKLHLALLASAALCAETHATLFSYDFSGDVTPTEQDTFFLDRPPGEFQGIVTWNSEREGLIGGSLRVLTSDLLLFGTDSLYIAGLDRHNFNALGGTTGFGEWTYGVPTDYSILILAFDRNTALQNAVLTVHAGVSNIITGEQRLFSMKSQITSVHEVPDGADTLSLLGFAMMSLVAIRRFTLVTP